jgi:hypothetical protein
MRVIQPANSGQIRRTVGAPVAHEGNDLGFEIFRFQFDLLLEKVGPFPVARLPVAVELKADKQANGLNRLNQEAFTWP